jgi:hypothetical protein
MSGGTIIIKPETLNAAAGGARALEPSITGIADRLRGAPTPQGAEKYAGQIRAAGRAVGATTTQLDSLASWLNDRAFKGLIADTSLFSMSVPLVPGKPWGGGAPLKTGNNKNPALYVIDGLGFVGNQSVRIPEGVGLAAIELGVGGYKLARVGGNYALQSGARLEGSFKGMGHPMSPNPNADYIRRLQNKPYMQDFTNGVKAIKHDPVKFGVDVLASTVAWNDWKKGHVGDAIGKMTVAFAPALGAAAKASTAGRAADGAAKAAGDAKAAVGRGQHAVDDAKASEASARGSRNALQGDGRPRDGETPTERQARIEGRAERRDDAQTKWDDAKDARKQTQDHLADLEKQAHERTAASEKATADAVEKRKEVGKEIIKSFRDPKAINGMAQAQFTEQGDERREEAERGGPERETAGHR